ncbi:MAG: helix-turn-helix transcriptional regulator [Deltaproteobacteria bacterium]|nr:helix-turn-helix transcriptional regulator [Deltaproteobacteria bacterium]
MRPFDFIGAIELAYDRTKGDEEWLAELNAAIAPGFADTTTAAYFFEVVGDAVEVGRTVSAGGAPLTRESFTRHHDEGTAIAKRPTRVAYECEMFTLLSRVVGADVAAASIRGVGISAADSLGLRANASPESGVMFATYVSRGFRIRHRALWTRFAAHVGSALRIRRAARALSPESATAVLTPGGRLEHAAESAVEARDDLASAAKRIDRARGKLRRLDPEEASSLWRAMVREEWSLVDWVDHDGKRFLLAQENRVPVAGRRALTDRERQIVACAAMGHSNKLIAYDLGLATGTVSVLLARAAEKLGVSGRVALIRAFRELGD